MSKKDNLTDFLTDVADAIRTKKGTTDPINPQDFSDEIAGIETGGEEAKLDEKSITANGTYTAAEDDLDGYSSVEVNVTPKTTNFEVSERVMKERTDAGVERAFPPPTGYYYKYVTVYPVTADIDDNITPDNIKDGVTILGVEGTYTGESSAPKLQEKDAEPALRETSVEPDDDYDGLSKVNVPALTKDYLQNLEPTLIPDNIKKGQSIFGVDGSYTGSEVVLQNDKVVTPTDSQQVIMYDATNYDGLGYVTVEAVPEASGDEIVLTSNGLHHAPTGKWFSKVNVEVASELTEQEWTVDLTSANGDEIDIPSNVKITKIIIPAIANLVAANVRKGVTILDVKGELETTTVDANIKPLNLSQKDIAALTEADAGVVGKSYFPAASYNCDGFNPVVIKIDGGNS